MAIQLYSGVPGSGKTYKMVADLDAFLQRKPDVNLVSNIKGLQLPHQDFDDMLLHYFPEQSLTILQRIEQFFVYEFQESLNVTYGGPVMYVLDECQEYFPHLTKLPNTERYLQRHRHLGHNLYLATQASSLLSSKVVALIEIELHAVRRSISFLGEFHYRRQSPQTHQLIDSKTVFPKKRIFNLYKSFDVGEIAKPKKTLWLKFWPLILLIFALYYLITNVFNVDKKVERMTGKPRSVSSSSVSSSAPLTAKPSETASFSNRPVSKPEPVTNPEIDRLQKEVEKLRRQADDTERVFLTVVKMGDKQITIDPDTQAIVDIRRIKYRIICINEGLTCYYDRPISGGIKIADTVVPSDIGMPSASSMGRAALESVAHDGQRFRSIVTPQAGPGSFVDESLVPAPIRYPGKTYNGLGD